MCRTPGGRRSSRSQRWPPTGGLDVQCLPYTERKYDQIINTVDASRAAHKSHGSPAQRKHAEPRRSALPNGPRRGGWAPIAIAGLGLLDWEIGQSMRSRLDLRSGEEERQSGENHANPHRSGAEESRERSTRRPRVQHAEMFQFHTLYLHFWLCVLLSPLRRLSSGSSHFHRWRRGNGAQQQSVRGSTSADTPLLQRRTRLTVSGTAELVRSEDRSAPRGE